MKEQRRQLWVDKGKDRLVCQIVRKDQQGRLQDDSNNIHSEVMDASLFERVIRVMFEWLRKIMEAMDPTTSSSRSTP